MTYKVLSIDLDYIMGPCIELYQHLFFDENPSTRWQHLFKYSDFTENHLFIDQESLIYCYDVFLKALKKNPKVTFGYDHDSILYDLEDKENIDIINIDHHDDVTAFDSAYENLDLEHRQVLEEEVAQIKLSNRVHEGNWGAWLHLNGRLEKFTWICNPNSKNIFKNYFSEELLGDKYDCVVRTDYDFADYNFDSVFVCLSPQYTPKNHWHYFRMFMMAYEEFTGNQVNIKNIGRKYEYEQKFRSVDDAILYKRSNGG
jgi:hypothetical protein